MLLDTLMVYYAALLLEASLTCFLAAFTEILLFSPLLGSALVLLAGLVVVACVAVCEGARGGMRNVVSLLEG